MRESTLTLSELQPSRNGTPRRRTKASRPPIAAGRLRQAARQAEIWASRYVGTAIVLSSVLNGYAAVLDSGAAHPVAVVAAALIGGIVPVLVWGLFKLAGWLHRARWSRLAVIAGGVGVCLLLLSVIHCSASIAVLTGSSLLLAILLAIGIDCGLVVSEVAAILVQED